MGLSISLLPWSWIRVMRNRIFGLAEAEAILKRSISLDEKDAMTALRSLSFKRTNSSKKVACNSPKPEVLEKSLSFKNWEPEATEIGHTVSPLSQAMDESADQSNCHKSHMTKLVVPDLKLPKSPVVFSSPRPLSELDAAATKVQKVYKSYRTRRTLADCAVVVEELWWKALDFASLKHSSVSFFIVEKTETASSRWARARTRAAKVGKGLSKDEKAQKLALQHWLEAIDPRHRYGHNLHLYYDIWSNSQSTEPFFYWLDIGEGREVNLENCPRSKLQSQCIKYLGPNERVDYEVMVEDGRLIYRKGQNPINTTEGSKWIFVLSTSRTLYVGKKQKGTFQHSSFLAGGATTAAGRLVAKEGVLEAIWPYSGHYLPTEENFKEFVSYLQDNNVDLSNVKRCSVDDDEYPSTKKDSIAIKAEVATKTEEVAISKEPSNETEVAISFKPTTMEFERRLSCKWTTGAGPRIGCVRDYPAELQSKALEQVNLSPKVIPSPRGNKVPIPSPRPSPKVRLSPRLQYMGIPTPTVSLTLPKHKGY